jgi:hypothetical protein
MMPHKANSMNLYNEQLIKYAIFSTRPIVEPIFEDRQSSRQNGIHIDTKK